MTKSPAIVISSEFTYSNSKGSFSGYLDYMNRKDAKEHDKFKSNKQADRMYFEYMDYMEDGKKNGQLFDGYEDHISAERKKDLVKQYHEAEEAGSPLWKDVISFNNEWLEEQGLYNSKTHWMNEDSMKRIVRGAVKNMVEKEKMRMPVWTASFHYNTDNLHVHVATVDLDPSHLPLVEAKNPKTKKPIYDKVGFPVLQRRGKRKQSTIDKVKSDIANKIIDRTPSYKRIDELIRDNARRMREIDLYSQKEAKKLLKKAIEKMPSDLRQWKYGYYTVDVARPYIDEISKNYLETHHKEEMQELIVKLDEQVMISEQLYGEESNHQEYKVNKLEDLQKRMGNAIISVMKDYRDEVLYGVDSTGNILSHDMIRSKTSSKGIRNGKYYYNFRPLNRASRDLNSAIFYLNKAMQKSFHDHQIDRNIAEFDRMMEGHER